MRDTKYKIEDGRIVNRKTGNAMRLGEPVFIIRAQDVYSVPALRFYSLLSPDSLTVHAAIKEFREWQEENRDLLKMPD